MGPCEYQSSVTISAFWSCTEWAVKVLLVKEKSYPCFAPVIGDACRSVDFEALHTLMDHCSNCAFGLLEQVVKGVIPIEFFLGRQSMTSACTKAYATWLMRPNHEWIPVMFVGVEKEAMASIISVMGLTPSCVIPKPPKSTSSFPKMNLLGLKMISLSAQCLM